MTEWTTEYNTEQPSILQEIAPDTYIQRKNIHQETTEIGNNTITNWISDSRKISKNEYNMLNAITEIDTDKAIDDYTLQLIEEGII